MNDGERIVLDHNVRLEMRCQGGAITATARFGTERIRIGMLNESVARRHPNIWLRWKAMMVETFEAMMTGCGLRHLGLREMPVDRMPPSAN